MQFMTAGDTGYFFLIRENCRQVRLNYPKSKILVYDFGFTVSQRDQLKEQFSHFEIIDWRDRVNEVPDVWGTMPEQQKRKLALAFNARKQGWRKRLRKALFKRFPNNPSAIRLKQQALQFENLLIQKIACMRDASDRVGDERLVFLDADAMLFKPIDDAFDPEIDVTLTLVSRMSWDENRCFVFNSGVIFFGTHVAGRNAFLDNWWEDAQKNNEWLREQSSLVRMIESTTERDAFTPGNRIISNIRGKKLRIRFEACDEFNFFDMENANPEDFPDARIYHFTGRRQQTEMFQEILEYLRRNRPKENLNAADSMVSADQNP